MREERGFCFLGGGSSSSSSTSMSTSTCGGVDMVAGFWVWWPAFGWLGCYGFAGFVVGTWWVLFCFIYLFFWVFGFGGILLGRR